MQLGEGLGDGAKEPLRIVGVDDLEGAREGLGVQMPDPWGSVTDHDAACNGWEAASLGLAGLCRAVGLLAGKAHDFAGQRPEALGIGDLLAAALTGVGRDGAGDSLVAGLDGERRIRAMAGRAAVGAAAEGLAAAEESAGGGAGARVADGGELEVDLVEVVLQGSGVRGSGHGAPFPSAYYAARRYNAPLLHDKGALDPND